MNVQIPKRTFLVSYQSLHDRSNAKLLVYFLMCLWDFQALKFHSWNWFTDQVKRDSISNSISLPHRWFHRLETRNFLTLMDVQKEYKYHLYWITLFWSFAKRYFCDVITEWKERLNILHMNSLLPQCYH